MKLIILILSLTSLHAFSQDVGIGTTTPTEKLDVAAGIRVASTTNSNPGTIRYDGTNNELQGHQTAGWKSLISSGTSYTFGGFTSTARNTNVRTPYSITVPSDGQYLIVMTTLMNNSQNYSGTVYDTHGYIYLRTPGNSTIISHHAAANEMESFGTGYTMSLKPAEHPAITLATLSKNTTLLVEATLNSTGTPAPTSEWSIAGMTVILLRIN